MNIDRLWCSVAVPLVILSAGCSLSADNPAGIDFSGRGPSSILTDTLVVTAADTSWTYDLSLDRSPVLMVGQYGGYEAATLLRFTSYIEGADVVTAKLILNGITADTDGDSTDTITLNLHRVTAEWDSSWSGEELGGLPAILGEVLSQRQIPLNETADTLAFSIPADVVQSWVDDAGEAAKGVALVATSPAAFLMHFDSDNAISTRSGLRPHLEYEYIHPDGGDLRAESIEAARDLSLLSYSGVPASDELWIGRGVPYRSLLTFDTSALPADITVNRAQLNMGVKADEGVNEEIAIVAALSLSEDPWNDDTVTSETTSPGVTVALSDSAVSLIVTGALRKHFEQDLQQLVLIVFSIGEGSGVGLTKLWDSTAAPPNRATLQIVYSLPSGITP
jgi:hypothetical protein